MVYRWLEILLIVVFQRSREGRTISRLFPRTGVLGHARCLQSLHLPSALYHCKTFLPAPQLHTLRRMESGPCLNCEAAAFTPKAHRTRSAVSSASIWERPSHIVAPVGDSNLWRGISSCLSPRVTVRRCVELELCCRRYVLTSAEPPVTEIELILSRVSPDASLAQNRNATSDAAPEKL